nr:hypothetical protein [Cupriavidus taiwanensis]
MELKYGYRLLASTKPFRLKTRNGADATAWFPEIGHALAPLARGYHILDGEVCLLDEIGRSDFDRLPARARRRGWHRGADPVVSCVFDALIVNGKDVEQAVGKVPQCALCVQRCVAIRTGPRVAHGRRGWKTARQLLYRRLESRSDQDQAPWSHASGAI